jgi:gamma-glutamyltranspeptidase/glutathione hydrolase
MSGIGGDGFIMVYWRATGQVEVVNATGAAPLAATCQRYHAGIPMQGMASVSTPGLLDGWSLAHQRYGSRPFASLFDEAITLAEEGVPVTPTLADYLAQAPMLLDYPTSRTIFAPHGQPLQAGQILRQTDLARTLRRIAAGGAEEFYRGSLGRELAAFSEQAGGPLAAEDLRRHHSRWQPAITTDYRGYTVYEAPPNSSGHVLLQELNIVEGFDLAALGWGTPAAIHLMVEAKRLAFADREAFVADPDWIEIPLAGLLDKGYAAERRRLIDPERALESVEAGQPWRHQPRRAGAQGVAETDTTCFAVVDGWGNAVCQLQSIQSSFGSGLVAGTTGILLNNRMTYWHLAEDHVDRLEPGKRVRHTMNPVMVLKDGRLAIVAGTPGADTQVQTNLQLLTGIIDHGLSAVEAVEAPRWRHRQDGTESTVPHRCSDGLELEARFEPTTGAGLVERGHPVEWVSSWGGPGSAMVITLDPTSGAAAGGADPRRDGYVAAS